MSPKITREHLARTAIVYVRQSSPEQLRANHESRRRQYALVDHARALGFDQVEVIDDDLGRSGSGANARPGFQRLVAALCAGVVGAVVCLEASRLARNGRDWHHLIDLCGLVAALVIDPDGVYDPRATNDRLLLGLKGTMSEYELGLLRQRAHAAIQAKAARGELRFVLPVGLVWSPTGAIEQTPDVRVQAALALAFRKFEELGSVRQTLLWFRQEGVALPATVPARGRAGAVVWRLPSYGTLHALVTNPCYAGAYAYGRRARRTRVVDGRARTTDGHVKPRAQWTVLLRDHHPGYIAWAQFEQNQRHLAENAHMKQLTARKAARGGKALLAGLLRCARCGRMLHVVYVGKAGAVARYFCRGANVNHGGVPCLSFGSLRADAAVGTEVLRVVAPAALEAAHLAAAQFADADADRRHAHDLALAQAHYEADLAARRHAAVDPAQRLVAAELERRWNGALEHVAALEQLAAGATAPPMPSPTDRATLERLAADLPAVWRAAETSMRLKQRIVRLLVHEIIADVTTTPPTIVLTIHWSGGRHAHVTVPKNATGRHGHCTSDDALDVIRRLALQATDAQLAANLNRLGLRTGVGHAWTAGRVAAQRRRAGLPAPVARAARTWLTLAQAAARLEISATVVRKLIARGLLPATQPVACAAWQIDVHDLDGPGVRAAAATSQQLAGPRARATVRPGPTARRRR